MKKKYRHLVIILQEFSDISRFAKQTFMTFLEKMEELKKQFVRKRMLFPSRDQL